MKISETDRAVLRRLGEEKFRIGSLPEQRERAERWRKLNGLEAERPLVWVNEVPWHEMNVDDELTLQCGDPWLQEVERALRRELYQWRHFPGDMVVDPIVYVPYVCSPTSNFGDYGVRRAINDVDNAKGGLEDAGRNAVIEHSVGWVNVIKNLEDVRVIHTPEVTFDRDLTGQRVAVLSSIMEGIVPVAGRGMPHWWCSPWDQMVEWYGIENLYVDMYENPELIHALCRRYTRALLEMMDKFEAMQIIDVSNGNHRVGSGGLGVTDQLPGPANRPDPVRLEHLWGSSTGQIFSEVSPDMHDEFCLQYELPYLERFGLNCYGCCEPLHNKVHLLRKIPRLRRISMSLWIDVDKGVEEVGTGYVFSYKPSPAVFAFGTWDVNQARKELRPVLEKIRNCRCEIIMKDVSTVSNDPRRLWEWAAMASELVEEL